jgi:molecular chaperone GrpE
MTMSGEQSQDQPRPREAAADEAVAPPASEAHEEPGAPGSAASEQPTDGVHAAADAPVEDGSDVEHDLDELVARAAKADEYLALAQRTQADFENFRRRMARDVAAAQERGIGKLAKELLPAIDNLDRALAAAELSAAGDQPEHHLASGVRLVHDELLAAFGRVGIEAFSPLGERFDPNHHEAMVQQPVEGAESGTVVEVYQQGYRLDGTVLRPARVVVAA